MRTLPRNINVVNDGLLVRIERRGIVYTAYVKCQRDASGQYPAEAIARAVALRDRFLAIHGAIAPRAWQLNPSQNSNTGLAGISETNHWTRSRPRPCFAVSYRVGPSGARRTRVKRFYYDDANRPREAALQQAIALRAQKTSALN